MITSFRANLARYRLTPHTGISARVQSLINAMLPAVEDVVAETFFRARMQINPSDLVQRTILLSGAFEPRTVELAMSLLKPGDQFIDAGAHVGLFTLAAGTAGAHVLCIEADPRTFARLCRNICLNDMRNVMPLCTALWSEFGILRMTRPEKLNTGMNRVASTSESNDGFISPSVTLDKVVRDLGITTIKLLKMDIEGAELPVLQSYFDCSPIKPENIIFEYWPEYFPDSIDVVSLLKTNGYEIRDILGKQLTPEIAPPEHNLWACLKS